MLKTFYIAIVKFVIIAMMKKLEIVRKKAVKSLNMLII
jgi:hypothetical protein